MNSGFVGREVVTGAGSGLRGLGFKSSKELMGTSWPSTYSKYWLRGNLGGVTVHHWFAGFALGLVGCALVFGSLMVG
jgi:hypothetical protein